jgi:protein-arginine kinase
MVHVRIPALSKNVSSVMLVTVGVISMSKRSKKTLSDEVRAKAKELVARGLQAAADSPAMTPEEAWKAFNEVQARIQAENISNRANRKRRKKDPPPLV